MTNILRSVETHIRVVTASDEIEHTSPSTIRFPAGSGHVFRATKVHMMPKTARLGTNQEFYKNALPSLIDSTLAGQSYTVLLCSPPNCGRSHTLYGNGKEKGIIELAAEELVSRRDTIVSVAAFAVLGENVTDTVTSKPIELRSFAPPIGVASVANLRSVEVPSDANIQAQRKHPHATYVVQLGVNRVLDTNNLRSAFALLTFVELAPFQPPVLPSDIQSLAFCMERAAKGGDPMFHQCKLTKFMQQSIGSSRSLVCITTITGNRETREGALTALQFLETASQLRQVTTLVQTVPPRCFVEGLRCIKDVRQLAQDQLEEARQAGNHAAFSIISQYVTCSMDRAPAVLTGSDEMIRAVRQTQLQKFNEAAAMYTDDANFVERRIEEQIVRATRANERLAAVHAEVAAHRAKIREDQETLQRLRADAEQADASVQLQQWQLETSHAPHKREVEALQKKSAVKAAHHRELAAAYNAACAWGEFDIDQLKFKNDMQVLRRKRQRCEEQLEAASAAARRANSQSRDDRERRSKVARLTSAEERVSMLKQIVGTPVSQLPPLGFPPPGQARQATPSPARHCSVCTTPKRSATPQTARTPVNVTPQKTSKQRVPPSPQSTKHTPLRTKSPSTKNAVGYGRSKSKSKSVATLPDGSPVGIAARRRLEEQQASLALF